MNAIYCDCAEYLNDGQHFSDCRSAEPCDCHRLIEYGIHFTECTRENPYKAVNR